MYLHSFITVSGDYTTAMDYDKLSYVKSSHYRTDVINTLNEPMIPKELAEATDKEIRDVSRALNELREKDIVELLVSENVKKGRLYGLTRDGEDIKEAL